MDELVSVMSELCDFTSPDIFVNGYPISFETKQEHAVMLASRMCGDETVMPEWKGIFHELLTRRAFVRFFEIWTHGNLDAMMRGLNAKEKLSKSFNGLLGSTHSLLGSKSLTKSDDGEWIVSNIHTLYPQIRRLPTDGIKNARKLAKQLQQERASKHNT